MSHKTRLETEAEPSNRAVSGQTSIHSGHDSVSERGPERGIYAASIPKTKAG